MAIEVVRALTDYSYTGTELGDKLEGHLAEVAKILEQMGYRPFNKLEVKIPGQAYDCAVSIFWSGN